MSALFARLPESRRQTGRRSPANAAVSVALHAAAISLAVVATATTDHASTPPAQPDTRLIWIPQPPPRTARASHRAMTRDGGPTTTRAVSLDPTAPRLPSLPEVAVTMPGDEPPVSLPPGTGIDEPWCAGAGCAAGPRSGSGAAGGVDHGPGEVFTGPQVELPAALRSPATPRYPTSLRDRQVEGRVTLRFVVDSAGRVEPASVQVVASTHDLFTSAVRAALPALRFTPARAGGRRVRQLVELPFTFELSR